MVKLLSSARPRSSAVLAGLATATSVVLWASAFVGIRSAGHGLQAGPLALSRLLFGSVALGALVLFRRERLPSARDLAGIAVTGALWYGVYNIWLNAAERKLDAGTSAMLIGIGPILISLIAGFALRDGFPRRLLLGLMIAFCGVLVIGLGTRAGGAGGGAGPVLMCLGAAVAYSVAMVLQKPLLKRTSPLQMTFLCCVAGLVVCLPYAPALVRQAATASGASLAWAAYLGVFPTAVGFTTWAYALARISAGRLAVTTYAVPPLSILMGWLLLGETPGGLAVAGGALCLSGVAVSRWTRRPAAETVAPAETAEAPDALSDASMAVTT